MSSSRESDLRTAEAATWSAKKGASFTRAAENPALYGRLYAAHCQALGLVLPERRQRGDRRADFHQVLWCLHRALIDGDIPWSPSLR